MKIEYVFIAIGIILAITLLYLGYTHLIKNKAPNDLKYHSSIDVESLYKALGEKENIKSIESTQSKLKAFVIDHNQIDIESIQKLGSSGIVEGKDSISIIFGKESQLIKEDIESLIK